MSTPEPTHHPDHQLRPKIHIIGGPMGYEVRIIDASGYHVEGVRELRVHADGASVVTVDLVIQPGKLDIKGAIGDVDFICPCGETHTVSHE